MVSVPAAAAVFRKKIHARSRTMITFWPAPAAAASTSVCSADVVAGSRSSFPLALVSYALSFSPRSVRVILFTAFLYHDRMAVSVAALSHARWSAVVGDVLSCTRTTVTARSFSLYTSTLILAHRLLFSPFAQTLIAVSSLSLSLPSMRKSNSAAAPGATMSAFAASALLNVSMSPVTPPVMVVFTSV